MKKTSQPMAERRSFGVEALTLLIFFLLAATKLSAAPQGLERGRFRLRVQFIVPSAPMLDDFKVELFHDSEQAVGDARVQPMEYFYFEGLSGGIYYVVAAVPGFTPVRQRIDVTGPQPETTLHVFMETKPPQVVDRPLDLSGEDSAVIDASNLSPLYRQLMEQLQLAVDELGRENVPVAQHLLESLVHDNPEFYEAHKALGNLYVRLGRFRDAETQFRKAEDLRPASAAPLISLGSLYLQEAEAPNSKEKRDPRSILSDAYASTTKAINLNPKAPFAYYLLGVTYYRLLFYEDAEENFLRSLELEPRLGPARVALANLYIQMQDWPRALDQFELYLRQHPEAGHETQTLEVRDRLKERIEKEKGHDGDVVVAQ
jgi:hypothetical protein